MIATPHAHITLSTGAHIEHTIQPNGSQLATVTNRPSGTMTEAEWTEYCGAS